MSSNPQNNLLHNSVRSIFADLIEPQLKNLLMIVTNISNTVERNEMRLDNLEKRLDSLTDIIDTTRNTGKKFVQKCLRPLTQNVQKCPMFKNVDIS